MKKTKKQRWFRRKNRVQAKVHGTAERPRLVVYKSLKTIFAQIINDEKGETIVSVHSKKIDKKTDAGDRKNKVAEAYISGTELAKMAIEKGIKKVVFDKSGFKYHGRIKALADGARDGGLEF